MLILVVAYKVRFWMEISKIEYKVEIDSTARFGEVRQAVASKLEVDAFNLHLVYKLDKTSNYRSFANQEEWTDLLGDLNRKRKKQPKKKAKRVADSDSEEEEERHDVWLKMRDAIGAKPAAGKVCHLILSEIKSEYALFRVAAGLQPLPR
jgi:hypothetical protein